MAQMTAQRVRSYLTTAPAAVRDRISEGVRTTPGRLTWYLAVIVVLGVLTGISAVVGAVSRVDDVDAVAHGSGPLAVQAQQLYRSLSDADATAAAAFLTSAAEPPALRQRYLDDIAAASAALAATSGAAGAAHEQVAQITTALPVYTGLIETARAQNRLNLPVGAAYLREASALMRQTLLPAADGLYRAETDRLAEDRSAAGAFPWLTVILILLTLAALAVAQVYLVRRTQRLVNPGLAVASLAGVVLLVWVSGSWAAVSGDLSRSDRDGSAQVQLVAQARILALQARADESLTLVARGSGTSFEDDFKARMNQLAGPGGVLDQARRAGTSSIMAHDLFDASHAVQTWQAQHTKVRELDDGGQYPDAVALAVVDPKGSSASFSTVDQSLARGIALAESSFDAGASDAGDGLVLAAVAWGVLVAVVVVGAVVGLQQRIAEYR